MALVYWRGSCSQIKARLANATQRNAEPKRNKGMRVRRAWEMSKEKKRTMSKGDEGEEDIGRAWSELVLLDFVGSTIGGPFFHQFARYLWALGCLSRLPHFALTFALLCSHSSQLLCANERVRRRAFTRVSPPALCGNAPVTLFPSGNELIISARRVSFDFNIGGAPRPLSLSLVK